MSALGRDGHGRVLPAQRGNDAGQQQTSIEAGAHHGEETSVSSGATRVLPSASGVGAGRRTMGLVKFYGQQFAIAVLMLLLFAALATGVATPVPELAGRAAAGPLDLSRTRGL